MIKRNTSTEEGKKFWERAEETAEMVRHWASWKRAGINISRDGLKTTVCQICGLNPISQNKDAAQRCDKCMLACLSSIENLEEKDNISSLNKLDQLSLLANILDKFIAEMPKIYKGSGLDEGRQFWSEFHTARGVKEYIELQNVLAKIKESL